MCRAILLVALTILTLVGLPAQAQDKSKCDPAAVIQLANNLKSTKDTQEDIAALLKLQDQIIAANIACNGLTFTGKGSKVVRPFDLPAGTYLLSLQTEGMVNGSLKAMGNNSSACYGNAMPSRAESRVDSKGCRATIEVMATDNVEWTITLEPLQ